MMHVDIDGTRVVLNQMTGELSLQVHSPLFPAGYQARITNHQNQETLLSAFRDKYPTEKDLPPRGTNMPRTGRDQMPLGVDSNNHPVTLSTDVTGTCTLMITGAVGTGKTVLGMGIADWALYNGMDVHVFERKYSFGYEYDPIQRKHARRGRGTLASHQPPFEYVKKRISELETTLRDNIIPEPEVWIVDFNVAEEDQEAYEKLAVDISLSARALNVKVVFMAQVHAMIPPAMRQFSNRQVAFKPGGVGIGTLTDTTRGRHDLTFRVGVPSLVY